MVLHLQVNFSDRRKLGAGLDRKTWDIQSSELFGPSSLNRLIGKLMTEIL